VFGRKLRCSFCGKSEQEVAKLIAGARGTICDACVRRCNEILEKEKTKKNELS
jgi:ATP-dependent Clp protease ATP-binding subunit ClpX